MSVKPSTASVTCRPIDQFMLLSVVENRIGKTYGRCSRCRISRVLMPEKMLVLVNSRLRRLIATERIRRAS